VLQTVKQVQQAGTPFAVILTQVPHQGGEGQEAHAGFAAKGVTMFAAASTSAKILQGDATR
jgi:chromosome partitioning protein